MPPLHTTLPSFRRPDVCFLSTGGIVLAVCLCMFADGCCVEDDLSGIRPDDVYDLDIHEPSDLCFGPTTDILYTVSDADAGIYSITTKGKTLSETPTGCSDLEGVCFVGSGRLCVAEERLRIVAEFDLQGNRILEKTISYASDDENAGIEGIAYAPSSEHFYIINQKDPGLLIETDGDLNILNKYRLKFADDYSGICVDDVNDRLWIVSGESESVYQCSLQGELIGEYRIAVKNPEGIAYDPATRTMYIVSDAKEQLYVFDFSAVDSPF